MKELQKQLEGKNIKILELENLLKNEKIDGVSKISEEASQLSKEENEKMKKIIFEKENQIARLEHMVKDLEAANHHSCDIDEELLTEVI